MKITAIIGGSGLNQLAGITMIKKHLMDTPYGKPSAELIVAEFNQQPLIFLARHGNPHYIAPHNINYRANIWALKQLGVEQIIAVAAVGGITPAMQPSRLIIPDQIVDYSYGREHTYFSGHSEAVQHIDFSFPYDKDLRVALMDSAKHLNSINTGTYACTQGPRLETAAEIIRLERDGCDVVGMTGMPEAALARELEISYVCCAVVANWAAGKAGGEIISMPEIIKNLENGMQDAQKLLHHFFSQEV